MDKIELRPYQRDDDGGGGLPHHHAARVDLTLHDGRVFSSTVRIAKGEAANPLSEDFLSEKFVRLAAVKLGMEMSMQTLAAVKKLETATEVTSLLQKLLKTRI